MAAKGWAGTCPEHGTGRARDSPRSNRRCCFFSAKTRSAASTVINEHSSPPASEPPTSSHPGDTSDPIRPAPLTLAERRSRRRKLIIAIVAGALLLGLLLTAASRFGWSELQDMLLDFDKPTTIALMAVLPLGGFSIAAVYVIAGAKFGLWQGGLVILGITAFHLLATHALTRTFLRRPMERYLERHRRHLPDLPESENASVAVIVSLVPGLPYFARNYILALSDIPLRTYFWICLPIYVIRSYVTLSLGDLSGHLEAKRVGILVAVYLVKLSICALLLNRVRHRLKKRSGKDQPR